MMVRSKSAKLDKNSVTLAGCRSLKEAEDILKYLTLEFDNLHEKLVIYKYKIDNWSKIKNMKILRLKIGKMVIF
jgi:hypothetical protein